LALRLLDSNPSFTPQGLRGPSSDPSNLIEELGQVPQPL
jgi:hypothetical protein